MPKITNLAELKNAAGSSTFVNPSNPAYATIRQFTNGLRAVQAELERNPDTTALAGELGRYADGIMAIQMGQPIYSANRMEQAVWDLNHHLPNFLQSGGDKTNYQTILETAQKANIMSKQALDQGLTIIGDAMGTNLNVGGSQRVEPAGPQPAPRQPAARPQEHNSVRFMEWRYRHQAELKANTAGFQGRTELPKAEALPKDHKLQSELYLRNSANEAIRKLQSLGALPAGMPSYPPEKGGVPTVFMMKDGKISTLEENGIQLGRMEGISPIGNPELTKAILRGEVFAYPAGERHPVQLQGKLDDSTVMSISFSAPLKSDDAPLAPEPTVSRPPRWYHRAFKFWGNNRKICTDYDTSKAAHDKWVRTSAEAKAAAEAIEKQFGEKRTENVRNQELTDAFRVADAGRVEANRRELAEATRQQNAFRQGIENVMELYAAKPVFKEEYTQPGKKLYDAELFQKLKGTDLDPGTVKIGDKPVSQREFATLAMFGSLNPDLMIKTQQDNARDKPDPILQSLEKEGYSEDMRKRMVGNIIGTASTVDVFVGDSRIHGYFGNAINGGRNLAAEALQAYPQNKEKLAEILANGLVFTGEIVGSTACDSTQYVGSKGMAQLSREMLDMMERDPELKDLTKAKFNATEEKICSEMNRQIEKYDDKQKNVLKPRTFDDTVKLIDNFRKLNELEQKGLDAKQKLLKAQAEEVDLLPEDKEACVKDILKANMADAMYLQEHKDRGTVTNDWQLKNPNGEHPDVLPNGQPNQKVPVEGKHNGSRFAQENYIKSLDGRAPKQEIVQGEDGDFELQMVGPKGLPKEQWVDPGAVTAVQSMNARFTEKAPTVSRMGQPERMAELDRNAEQIMRQDGLDKLNLEELTQKLIKAPTYQNGNMALRVLDLEKNQPGLNQNAPQKNLGDNQINGNPPVRQQPGGGGPMV